MTYTQSFLIATSIAVLEYRYLLILPYRLGGTLTFLHPYHVLCQGVLSEVGSEGGIITKNSSVADCSAGDATDDLFIAAQRTQSEKEVIELEKVKKKRLAAMKTKEAAKAIVQQKGNEFQELHFSSLTVVELDILLRWYNSYSGKMTKQEKVSKLTERYNLHLLPASTEEWTADDEGKLQRLKSSDINLSGTREATGTAGATI